MGGKDYWEKKAIELEKEKEYSEQVGGCLALIFVFYCIANYSICIIFISTW
jgi:hypothetical protein